MAVTATRRTANSVCHYVTGNQVLCNKNLISQTKQNLEDFIFSAFSISSRRLAFQCLLHAIGKEKPQSTLK